jgi:hypothetical protein
MNARQLLRPITPIFLLLLFVAILLPSCGGKGDTPRPSPEVSSSNVEMKYDVDIQSPSPIDVSFTATKGYEPNIYRDGKLISQGNYMSDNKDANITKLHTEFVHTGKAFVLGVSFSIPSDANSSSVVPTNLVVKMYVAGKLVQTYKKVIEVKNTLSSEQFTLTGDMKQ